MNSLNTILDKIASNKRSHFWLFFIVLLFLSFIMVHLYQPLCPGQDFFFHYRRLQALMDGMKESPLLIYLDYNAIDGYGYFTKAFYPDFVLIPFAFIGNLTSISFAYQFMIFTMTVLCGVFTYITVNIIYRKSFAAAIAALLYTFCVYRLLDLYHRAALGETLTFTFIPLVFLGLYHIIKGDYRKWYILAVGFSLMIFTHLISSVLMFLTLVIFLIIYYKPLKKEPKRLLYLLVAGIATLIITAYYIFPMLEQMSSGTFYYESRNLMAKTQDSALDFHWLIWGMFSGIVEPGQAFIPGVGFMLTGVVALRLFVYERSEGLKSVDIAVVIGLFFIFASSPLFPWSVFPFNKLNFIQMAWRLFEFSSFFFAVAGGYYLSLILKTRGRRLTIIFIISVMQIFVLVSDAQSYRKYRCGRPVTQIATFTNDYHLGGMEYLPSKVPSLEYLHQRGDNITVTASGTASNQVRENRKLSFDIFINRSQSVELPLIYYKGYTAKLNDKSLIVDESDNGLVQITADESGHIEVYYGGTSIQKVSYFITLAAIFAFCIYIFLQRRQQRKINTNI
ncbi:6-pyruvoyl-tetrahydropterin synthase-related protein [Prevotella sp. 10(H)]|uniref:6-pyruvoyl-tetrahydropterin synthase-related protein n=1 Tax=Prevotella sp. 10(H) TaxID=1158294 RepID=UPI0004A73701|nr:6-pyruvoyl-tetrahydropterin synthase-related protein [Prevotella sp. 10(H)]